LGINLGDHLYDGKILSNTVDAILTNETQNAKLVTFWNEVKSAVRIKNPVIIRPKLSINYKKESKWIRKYAERRSLRMLSYINELPIHEGIELQPKYIELCDYLRTLPEDKDIDKKKPIASRLFFAVAALPFVCMATPCCCCCFYFRLCCCGDIT
jgi:hypothetical protein